MARPDDTARTWRELIPQLTPDQIARLERAQECNPDDVADILDDARTYANRNLADRVHFGHLPDPDGAVKVQPCHNDLNIGGVVVRPFTGIRYSVGGVNATIEGVQCPDGTVFRDAVITVDDFADMPHGRLNPDQLRELGLAFTALADELERLNGDNDPRRANGPR